MAFLNSNNFARWGDVVNIDPSMSALSNWNEADVAPIGDNESTWAFLSGKIATIDGAATSTKGLSQAVNIKKGYSYMVNWSITENLYGDTDFYLYAVAGSTKQLIATQRLGAATDQLFTYGFEADNNYTKIVICAVAVSGVGISAWLTDFRLIEIGACGYALPLLENDTLRIFLNASLDDTVVPFSGLKIGLYLHGQGLIKEDIMTLTQINVVGDLYQLYTSDYVVPGLPNGDYSFVLYADQLGGFLIYHFSNLFKKASSAGYTSVVRYRNSADTLGYLYETLTSWENEFRIDLFTGRPTYQENLKGYETYQGDFIKTKSDITKLREFQTRFFDEGAHEAFSSMLAHSEIYIDDVEYKRTPDGSYEISWNEFDDVRIATGGISLLEVDYSTSVKKC